MSPLGSDSSGLSRRQILGLVGSASAAGALTGAATGANLLDRERFDDNSIVTGTFGLSLDCEGENCGIDQRTVVLSVSDLTPGDSGDETVTITVEDNDGWVWLRTACPDPAGLANNVEIRLLFDGHVLKDPDGEDVEGSLSTVQKQLADGVQLTPVGEECLTADDEYGLQIEYNLPNEVRSTLESTETSARFEFRAEQCRHNDSRMNPFGASSCEEPCLECGEGDGNKIARAAFEYDGPETTVELAQGSTGSKNGKGKRASQGDSVLSETVSSGDTITADFHGETNYGPDIDFIAEQETIACFHISCSAPFGPGLQITGEHDGNTYTLTVVSAADTDGNSLCSVAPSAKNSCSGGSKK
ncbi:hypothetical protein [Halalkalirubrum salinum]|uniref:hypothetical protein n=1 Tax=Halalkalirubrum salinum TaxID=2563889 RepID=UPI0010FBAD5B|nr:hypothetical protein [Halalkalirubrum salinum]